MFLVYLSEICLELVQSLEHNLLESIDVSICALINRNNFRYSSMLKPQPSTKPSIELLAQAPEMDNNRLEKLVKNFVHEDKARLAAQAKTANNKPMPSSIQYALQKFEKNSTPVVENGFGSKKLGGSPVAAGPAKKPATYGQMTVEQVCAVRPSLANLVNGQTSIIQLVIN